MTKKTAYWLGAAILVILLISIYSIKIIFWPQYKFTGRVIDIETKQPIAGATVYFVDTDKYTHTDSGGFFKLKSDNTDTPFINIEARGFQDKLLDAEYGRILTTTRIGTVSLESAVRVGWPIPEEIRKRYIYYNNLQPPNPKTKIQRTTRLLTKLLEPPIELTNLIRLHSLKDSAGGEWYLFNYWGSSFMLTYINPDNSFERYIPTPLMPDGYRSLDLNKNRLYLKGVIGKSAEHRESYIDSFSIADFHTDTDNDSLLDRFEMFYGLNPYSPDTDNDDLLDIDDPLPTVPYRVLYNDTTALLQEVLKNSTPPPLYISGRLTEIIERKMKINDARWFSNLLFKHEIPVETRNLELNSFESVLSRMDTTELRQIASILRNYFDDPETDRLFSYYHLLSGVNERNIDSVKAVIIKSFYRTLLIPVYVRGDIIDYVAHPNNSPEMMLPINSFEFRHNVLDKYYIRENIELIKMNATEAIVHYETKGFGYELVYIKRNGWWIQVDRVPLNIS